MTTEEINFLDTEQFQVLFELYLRECKQSDITASLRDFTIWLQER